MDITYFDRKVDRSEGDFLTEALTPSSLKEKGVMALRGAEFGFRTCPSFIEGIRQFLDNGLFGFQIPGEEYRQMMASWLRLSRKWEVDPSCILPAHGTIFALCTLMRLYMKESTDALLTLSPEYGRYHQAARRMGREVMTSPMSEKAGGYEIDFRDLEEKFACERVRFFCFSHPHNPTGKVFTEEELEKIHELSVKYHKPVFADEIFADFALKTEKVVSYGEIRKAGEKDLSVITTGLGKAFSLTGVNHACLVIPGSELREAYDRQKYADHFGSLDPMLMAGLKKALNASGTEFIRLAGQVVTMNAKVLSEALTTCFTGVTVYEITAGFTLWADFSGCGLSGEELKHRMEEMYLIGDEGSEYGSDDLHYRFNLAIPSEEMKKITGFMYNI